MADLVMKQLVAIIDKRTTTICLNAAGQIRPVGRPFNTLAGDFMEPPFHVSCRSMSVPWMSGMAETQRADANAEMMTRPLKQRDWRKFENTIPGPQAEAKAAAVVEDPAADLQALTPTAEWADVEINGWGNMSRAAKQAWEDFQDGWKARNEAFAEKGGIWARIAELARRWCGNPARMKTVRSEILAGQWDDVLAAIRSTRLEAPPLYRGLQGGLQHPEAEEFIKGLQIGSEFDLRGLSSFSEDMGWAEIFSEGMFDMSTASIVVRNARGLPLTGISPTAGEREWLVGGRLRVIRIFGDEVDENGFRMVDMECEWVPE